ncbi:hypothetical protein IP88_12990 [alpha proteobacterium AAP81b]|nr:hypothetical protein IP88_12990 [alpha proteobacterium AAP81b]
MHNKAANYVDALTERDLAQVLALLTDDAAVHGPDGAIRGQADICRLFRRRFALGATLDVTDMTVDGSAVTIAYRAQLCGAAADGRDLLRFAADGRIAEVRLQPSLAERLALAPVAGHA